DVSVERRGITSNTEAEVPKRPLLSKLRVIGNERSQLYEVVRFGVLDRVVGLEPRNGLIHVDAGIYLQHKDAIETMLRDDPIETLGTTTAGERFRIAISH